MKLVQVAEENKRYYTKEFIHGFNTGAKTQLEADKKEAERRGRWIENEFGAYCSECGLYAYRSNGIPWKSNYCPMCGARLEATK